MSAPHRFCEANIHIGADSLEAFMSALREIHLQLSLYPPEATKPSRSISGGPDAGWSVEIDFDPTMTHDKYFEELDKFLGRGEQP
jgi:hypothetical protein